MKNPLVILLILGVFLSSCNSVRVLTDMDKKSDFSKFQSYGFMNIASNLDSSVFTQLNQQRFQDAIRAEMDVRGYMESDNPDLEINIFVTHENKEQVAYDHAYHENWGYGGWYAYDVPVFVYKEGTLFIDLINASKKQLAWQGIATRLVNKSVTNNRGKNISEAVSAIFKKYPHEAGKMNSNIKGKK